MAKGHAMFGFRRWLAAAAVAGSVMAPVGAMAAEEAAAPAGPNTGKLSFSGGFDVTTAYWFRGIAQENQGFIIQPYADMGVALYKGDGPLQSIDFNVGIWNSFHSEQTFATGTGGVGPDAWYESDLYAGFTFGLMDKFSLGMTYTALTSPNNGFDTIQELGFSLSYDDSELLGQWAMAPSITLVQELDNQADGGSNEGQYFQIAFGPTFTIVDSKEYPITLNVPVTVGLSLNDYYQDASTKDSTFGFFDIGADVSVPLAFVSSEYGAWTLTAGVHYIHLSQNAAALGAGGGAITDGDRDSVYGKVGVSFSY